MTGACIFVVWPLRDGPMACVLPLYTVLSLAACLDVGGINCRSLGSLSAFVYAILRDETDVPFVFGLYGGAVAFTSLVGALIESRLPRWRIEFRAAGNRGMPQRIMSLWNHEDVSARPRSPDPTKSSQEITISRDQLDDRPFCYWSPRTIAANALSAIEPTTGALTQPIHIATTYVRDADNGYSAGFVYGRPDNATIQQVEALLAELEHANEAMMFSSGMAAATAVLLSLPPTHVVAPRVMFWGLRQWMRGIARYGHEVDFVDMDDVGAVRSAVVPGRTGLVWIETPSNPLWTITDIEAVCDYAHRAGAIVCADSTVATPVLSKPLDLGCDLVVHSATKYLNGHSDVVAGTVATARVDATWARIKDIRLQHGGFLGPFDAYLLLRGLRTLDLRVTTQSLSAQLIAERLVLHPAIGKVLYPGLPGHPGHAVAARQMERGFGGMLSIHLGSRANAIAVAANVQLWRRATSFGGTESLIEHRASIEGEGSPCPDDLLRLSVGLEDPEDLYRDLARALSILT